METKYFCFIFSSLTIDVAFSHIVKRARRDSEHVSYRARQYGQALDMYSQGLQVLGDVYEAAKEKTLVSALKEKIRYKCHRHGKVWWDTIHMESGACR